MLVKQFGQASRADARASAALVAAAERTADLVESADLREIIEASGQTDASDQSREGDPDMLRGLIDRVTVSPGSVSIVFDRAALVDALIASGAPIEPLAANETDAQSASETDAHLLTIDVPAQTLRCGKQVRLIVGAVSTEHRSSNPKLIRLIADAHRWFEDLRIGRAATIAEIAARDGQQVSHVSRALPLAFLAPDIVEAILEGRQPPTLTVERLRVRRRPIPMGGAA